MAGLQDFETFCDDFNGTVAAFPTSADPATPWLVDDTSSSGSPTYTTGGGAAVLTLASTTEVENVSLHFGDSLDFDIDLIQRAEFRVKTEAALDSATVIIFGLTSARNDSPDTIAAGAIFKLGSTAGNNVSVETDDTANNNDDVATGKTLVAAYKSFVIDFTGGKSNVKFYINGERVAASTTFDMSNYSAGLQPIVQIQKTSDANTDSVSVDYIQVVSRRA